MEGKGGIDGPGCQWWRDSQLGVRFMTLQKWQRSMLGRCQNLLMRSLRSLVQRTSDNEDDQWDVTGCRDTWSTDLIITCAVSISISTLKTTYQNLPKLADTIQQKCLKNVSATHTIVTSVTWQFPSGISTFS